MIALFQWIMSHLQRGSLENWDIKNSTVMCSGFNNDYKSSEPLKTLVRPKLFYVYTFYTYWTFGALKLFNIVVNKVNKETYVRLSSIFLKPESKESLI